VGDIRVQVRYFASVREALGDGETVQVPVGTTVARLRQKLAGLSPEHAAALGEGCALRVAVDQAMSDEQQVLRADAEVAFFPPVTGG